MITDYIKNMAQQLCNNQPGAKPPPLRTIGDTYTVRPENPCQYDDQHPACIADHVEKALYFRNRSLACYEEFKRNAQADKPEVTCPVASDTPTSPAPASTQGGLWRDITRPWENVEGWGLFILICAAVLWLWPSRSGSGRSSGTDPDEPYHSPEPDGSHWKR
ncbi:hypothetical protein ACIA5C_21645 [Actinoplanes sp. NPDC051343]|uniref:hypothetical protein n=1 Tax=Actinoplanes sp. NPDC051343 TaxID=3363906 RepID=UPI00379AF6F6